MYNKQKKSLLVLLHNILMERNTRYWVTHCHLTSDNTAVCYHHFLCAFCHVYLLFFFSIFSHFIQTVNIISSVCVFQCFPTVLAAGQSVCVCVCNLQQPQPDLGGLTHRAQLFHEGHLIRLFRPVWRGKKKHKKTKHTNQAFTLFLRQPQLGGADAPPQQPLHEPPAPGLEDAAICGQSVFRHARGDSPGSPSASVPTVAPQSDS